jgi:polyisoprenoid-binding protein YceI
MTWTFDKSHTQIEFSVKHMMFSTTRGSFKNFDGTMEFDEQNPAASTVNVTIDVASVDTRDEKRDGHLKSPDFFDVAQYPTMTFKSTSVAVVGENHYTVTGDLTLHGVTQTVPLDVQVQGKYKTMRGTDAYAFAITTTINRKDFGLIWNVALESGGVLVSDEVKISIDAEVLAVAPVSA